MQVRRGGEARLADVADDLILHHAAADADAAAVHREMAVERAVGSAVLDHDGVAVATALAAEHNLAVAGGPDRRSGRCGVVDALMGAHAVEDRMPSRIAEPARDAGEIDGVAR